MFVLICFCHLERSELASAVERPPNVCNQSGVLALRVVCMRLWVILKKQYVGCRGLRSELATQPRCPYRILSWLSADEYIDVQAMPPGNLLLPFRPDRFPAIS